MSQDQELATKTTETDGTQPSDSTKKTRADHLWKPGQSGNPAGRTKGSKNKLTLLKEAVLEQAEEIVLDNWVELVQSTVDLAKQGDSTCIKILWDRIIPAKRAVEDKKGEQDKYNVNIIIEGLAVKGVEVDSSEIVEAEYEEVKDA